MLADPAERRTHLGGPYIREERHSYLSDQYPAMVRNNRLRASDLLRMRDLASSFDYKPLMSIMVPVRGAKREWLERALDSVLAQAYPHWELCVCDDGSTEEHVGEVLDLYTRLDGRIKVKSLESNENIVGATNHALSLAEGEYVGLLDHDDELSPDALFEVVKLLQQHPEANLVYSDEDKIDAKGQRSDPHFKPGWSPDLLLSVDYISRLSVYRKSVLEEIGGFSEGFEEFQDYDLILRFTERTQEVQHIPKILYHRRTVEISPTLNGHSESHKEEGRRALSEALERRGLEGTVEDGLLPDRFRVKLKVEGEPKVSIIVPTRDKLPVLRKCLESIENKTTYSNYEILIVDNVSTEPETINYLARTPHRVIRFEEEFNYSRINNLGVSMAEGEYVLFLNNDTEVISEDWIEAMLEHAQREEVGAVGAKLLYPDGKIQHAGVITGIGSPFTPGVASHSHQHYPADFPGHGGALKTVRNYNAVTAACMMLRRSLFLEVGGLDDENLKVAFNDVDLCLRLREQGYHIMYTPYAELYHHESASRGYGTNPTEILYMRERWGKVMDDDPYYNPNFSAGHGDFYLRADILRPRILRSEAGELEKTTKHPLAMDREERQRYVKAQQKHSRSSRKTALVPAPVRKHSMLLAALRDQEPAQRSRRRARSRKQDPRSTSPPFFIVGQPKSGTSWVQFTLNSHPEIVCLGEGKFFGRDFRKSNPSSGGWLPSLHSFFADSEDFKTWATQIGPWFRKSPDSWDEDFERHLKGLTKTVMNYFFDDARARRNKPIVGDKTPAHVMYLDEIRELYSEAKVIHVIRDGRDQGVSSVFHWWRESESRQHFFSVPPEVRRKWELYQANREAFGPDRESIFEENYLRGLAGSWKGIVSEARRRGPELFGERYFEVRYEDLLVRPEELFGELMRFLGARSDKEVVEECIARNSFERRSNNRQRGTEDPKSFYRKGISGDWRNYFTERDRQAFKEEAGDFLIELGYEKDMSW